MRAALYNAEHTVGSLQVMTVGVTIYFHFFELNL